jgi:hypothetical protein
MPTIRERSGQFHVQVRMAGFPARTGSFPTRRLAERWAKTIEAEMIEGRHFRNAEARRRTFGDAIDRYTRDELPKKRGGGMHSAALRWWRIKIGARKMADVTRGRARDFPHDEKLGTASGLAAGGSAEIDEASCQEEA